MEEIQLNAAVSLLSSDHKKRPGQREPSQALFGISQPLKLAFGWPSSSRSPMRFTASLRIEADAKTIIPNRGIDERDHIEGGNQTGDLANEAEVFECFHGDREAVSTALARVWSPQTRLARIRACSIQNP